MNGTPPRVDRNTYQAQVDALRIREKAHTREGDAIAAARRRLPAPEQCEGCTWVTSQVRELSYIHSRDVTYATFCQGPYDEGARYRIRINGRPTAQWARIEAGVSDNLRSDP